MLTEVLRLQRAGVGWKLGGLSEQDGFDSPSLAAYVLSRRGLLPGTLEQSRARLLEVFPAHATPVIGDLIFYPQAYVMFYFVDEKERLSSSE